MYASQLTNSQAVLDGYMEVREHMRQICEQRNGQAASANCFNTTEKAALLELQKVLRLRQVAYRTTTSDYKKENCTGGTLKVCHWLPPTQYQKQYQKHCDILCGCVLHVPP